LKGGVSVKETKIGSGPEAKKGKFVHVYYSGKLKTGKQFDKCLSGKPFKFRLGGGDVIKGWDVGIEGMKVGGKRTITIPPAMGYGSQRMGNDIPANSTLVFDVELKAVS
jgi:FK506-binding nuclear protein